MISFRQFLGETVYRDIDSEKISDESVGFAAWGYKGGIHTKYSSKTTNDKLLSRYSSKTTNDKVLKTYIDHNPTTGMSHVTWSLDGAFTKTIDDPDFNVGSQSVFSTVMKHIVHHMGRLEAAGTPMQGFQYETDEPKKHKIYQIIANQLGVKAENTHMSEEQLQRASIAMK